MNEHPADGQTDGHGCLEQVLCLNSVRFSKLLRLALGPAEEVL